VICGGPGVSDAYYCKECTIQEKDVNFTQINIDTKLHVYSHYNLVSQYLLFRETAAPK